MSRQPFGLHLGYMPPLFFTATRCRDPFIRRQAITILHNSRPRERVWDSCALQESRREPWQSKSATYSCRDVRIMLVHQNFDTGTYIHTYAV
jgi:hypothetical protein